MQVFISPHKTGTIHSVKVHCADGPASGVNTSPPTPPPHRKKETFTVRLRKPQRLRNAHPCFGRVASVTNTFSFLFSFPFFNSLAACTAFLLLSVLATTLTSWNLFHYLWRVQKTTLFFSPKRLFSPPVLSLQLLQFKPRNHFPCLWKWFMGDRWWPRHSLFIYQIYILLSHRSMTQLNVANRVKV